MNDRSFTASFPSYSLTVLTFDPLGPTAAASAAFAQPTARAVAAGASATFTATSAASGTLSYQWQRNGTAVANATAATFNVASTASADAGLYRAVVTGSASGTSEPVILGVATTDKVIGNGSEIGHDIPHPNTKIFDQVLLNGAAATITADPGQVTRTSFIDLTKDIVQVEFSGAGSLSLVLDDASAPAPPENYNQGNVSYVKGHVGLVITGADESTNVSVFTVGRATAFDNTGTYNILLAPSATNDPAKNGSPLFQGHETTAYDAVADLSFIAIASTNGKFGGVRTSNASYFAHKGLTGLYAPGVQFTGPVFIGNIDAFDTAIPALVLGSASDVRITGGDLHQTNGQAIQVSGVMQVKFTPGLDSNGTSLPAQANRAIFQRNGVDVTAQIVAP